jgi:hypothetical protein
LPSYSNCLADDQPVADSNRYDLIGSQVWNASQWTEGKSLWATENASKAHICTDECVLVCPEWKLDVETLSMLNASSLQPSVVYDYFPLEANDLPESLERSSLRIYSPVIYDESGSSRWTDSALDSEQCLIDTFQEPDIFPPTKTGF